MLFLLRDALLGRALVVALPRLRHHREHRRIVRRLLTFEQRRKVFPPSRRRDIWQRMVLPFARTGRAAAVGPPLGPGFDLVRRPTMRIATTCEVIENRHPVERELWKALGYIG